MVLASAFVASCSAPSCSGFVNEARALGARRLVIAQMLANVALDGFVGAIPIVGDAFDFAFRANRRNMALLRDHLDRGRPRDRACRMRASDHR